MKNEMTLTAKRNITGNAMTCTAAMAAMAANMLAPVCRYYSHVLGRTVGTRQALLIINAQVAFMAAVFPTECPFAVRGLFVGWLISALLKCRAAGIKGA